ncbi:MAG: flagellar biosynthesis anti-sigma factor FlgM [Gammaproteobacteria bacterium]|nr:flagellar biosynthesis anti-sigma factor FlgM [Gammaproteobacteria bacterium]
MADKISGYGRNGVDITSARSRETARKERAPDADKAGAGARTGSSSTASQVNLTSTATNLKQIEARIKDLPDVDRARVDAMRQRVESGTYEVDAKRLADRLLAFERDLA